MALNLAERAKANAERARAAGLERVGAALAREWYEVRRAGADPVQLFVCPAQPIDVIRGMYPGAAVTPA